MQVPLSNGPNHTAAEAAAQPAQSAHTSDLAMQKEMPSDKNTLKTTLE